SPSPATSMDQAPSSASGGFGTEKPGPPPGGEERAGRNPPPPPRHTPRPSQKKRPPGRWRRASVSAGMWWITSPSEDVLMNRMSDIGTGHYALQGARRIVTGRGHVPSPP